MISIHQVTSWKKYSAKGKEANIISAFYGPGSVLAFYLQCIEIPRITCTVVDFIIPILEMKNPAHED